MNIVNIVNISHCSTITCGHAFKRKLYLIVNFLKISFFSGIFELFSVMWLTQWLGTLIRAQVFDVNNGNEDKADLVNPANYDLENTQNFYFR